MYDRNYRSWHVYAANLFVAMLFFLYAPVKAGTEIDQAGKDFHACIDANECNNEIYGLISTDSGPNLQYAGTQTPQVNVRIRYALEDLPPYMQPFLDLPRDACIRIGSYDSQNPRCAFYPVAAGEVCTVTDVNGDARTVDPAQGGKFYNQFTKVVDFAEREYYRYLYLDVRVHCSDY